MLGCVAQLGTKLVGEETSESHLPEGTSYGGMIRLTYISSHNAFPEDQLNEGRGKAFKEKENLFIGLMSSSW